MKSQGFRFLAWDELMKIFWFHFITCSAAARPIIWDQLISSADDGDADDDDDDEILETGNVLCAKLRRVFWRLNILHRVAERFSGQIDRHTGFDSPSTNDDGLSAKMKTRRKNVNQIDFLDPFDGRARGGGKSLLLLLLKRYDFSHLSVCIRSERISFYIDIFSRDAHSNLKLSVAAVCVC